MTTKGRAPHGARGLKRINAARRVRAPGRAPHGARGLKHKCVILTLCLLLSRPAWGAWIETPAPQGSGRALQSRPAWGAWIETAPMQPTQGASSSRPTRGAWIETTCAPSFMLSVMSRAPHGARGLKLILMATPIRTVLVAPHTGRVD